MVSQAKSLGSYDGRDSKLEGLARASDAHHRGEELSHGCDEGELLRLAPGDEAFIEAAQPDVLAHCLEGWHPELGPQLDVADAADGASLRRALARVIDRRGNADVRGERSGVAEGVQVDLRDHACGGVGADAVDAGQELADLVLLETALDVVVERLDARSKGRNVLTSVARLEPVGRPVVAPHGALREFVQALGEPLPDAMAAVVDEVADGLHGRVPEGRARGKRQEQRRGFVRAQVANEAGELGEGQIDRPVQLAHAVAEVLHESIAQADKLAQLERGLIGQGRGRGPFLLGEASDGERVEGVGLGSPQVLTRESNGCAAG